MAERYKNPHLSQYRGSARLARMGCTPTSGANGANAATRGAVDKTPDQVLALVPVADEVNPKTPGWALQDLDRAMAALGVPFEVRSGQGWAAAKKASDSGLYVVLQGVSAVFPGTTCSGDFDGTHCIGWHPDIDGDGDRRIDDPICGSARYESETTLRRYAQALSLSVFFGVFTNPVPLLLPDTATEEAMKLASKGPVIGTAKMIDDWPLWRVRDDSRTAKVSKGTVFDVRGVATYHDQYTGYLVLKNGEDHILPSDRVSVFTVRGG